MAYALAWISVSGGESVMPPWVRVSFPEAALIVRQLRDTNCGHPSCAWCATMNDPKGALKRWFGFPSFRPEPTDTAGRPLQEVIVERAMGHDHVLGILPTGTGKSVCYQVPALSLYDKMGALTVVISPLVALIARHQPETFEEATHPADGTTVLEEGLGSDPFDQDSCGDLFLFAL